MLFVYFRLGVIMLSANLSSQVSVYRLVSSGPAPCIYIFLTTEKSGCSIPVTGISASADYQAYFLAPDTAVPQPFELVEGRADGDQCGFWEVDRHLMPGMYGLRVSSRLRSSGYTCIRLCFVSAAPVNLQIHGVDYDPYDTFALGLKTWVRTSCHENLTSGLRKSMPAMMRPLLAKA